MYWDLWREWRKFWFLNLKPGNSMKLWDYTTPEFIFLAVVMFETFNYILSPQAEPDPFFTIKKELSIIEERKKLGVSEKSVEKFREVIEACKALPEFEKSLLAITPAWRSELKVQAFDLTKLKNYRRLADHITQISREAENYRAKMKLIFGANPSEKLISWEEFKEYMRNPDRIIGKAKTAVENFLLMEGYKQAPLNEQIEVVLNSSGFSKIYQESHRKEPIRKWLTDLIMKFGDEEKTIRRLKKMIFEKDQELSEKLYSLNPDQENPPVLITGFVNGRISQIYRYFKVGGELLPFWRKPLSSIVKESIKERFSREEAERIWKVLMEELRNIEDRYPQLIDDPLMPKVLWSVSALWWGWKLEDKNEF